MFEFQFNFPTKILFGINSLNDNQTIFTTFGKKAFIITGKQSYKDSGAYQKMQRIFESTGIKYELFNSIGTNPTEEQIIQGADIVRSFKPEFLLSIGGGSAHDAAKAINVLSAHEEKLHEYTVLGEKSVPGILNKMLPLITIPTISGTGAEISPAALVRINNLKEIIFSPFLYPQLSIINPQFMISAPFEISSKVGIDSFIQGLEAFLAKSSNPLSDTFALKAIEYSFTYLPKIKNNLSDVEARSYIALASLLSLLAVSLSGVGAIHALSDPLSGRYNIHHGQALSLLATEVLKYNLPPNKNKLSLLSNCLNISRTEINSIDHLTIISKIDNFLNNLGLNSKKEIGHFSIQKDDLQYLVKESNNPDMSTNIIKLSDEDVKKIFKSSFIGF